MRQLPLKYITGTFIQFAACLSMAYVIKVRPSLSSADWFWYLFIHTRVYTLSYIMTSILCGSLLQQQLEVLWVVIVYGPM